MTHRDMRWPHRRGTTGGFTLLELVAVIALMAILTGAVAWSLSQQAVAARRANVVGEIRQADRLARLTARRFNQPTVLCVNLDEQRLWHKSTNADDGPATNHPYALPDGYRIDEVVTLNAPDKPGSLKGDASIEQIDSGTARVAVSRSGRSVSYALKLVSTREAVESSEQASASRPWLVVSGLTGQMTLREEKDEVDALFETLASGGA